MFIPGGLERVLRIRKKQERVPITPEEIAVSSNPEAFEALVNFARETADKPKQDWEKLPTFWELLTNPDLLPPKGKNILPNFSDLTDPELVKNSILTAIVILNALTLAPDSAESKEAKKSLDSKQIEWALEALDHIDPMIYLEYQKSVNESRDINSGFTEMEKNILTWNLYHEARGENEIGKLGVLLNSLNRMQSPKFPSTAQGVVFSKYQNSWTLNLTDADFVKKKIDLDDYTKLRGLVEEYTDNTFGNSKEKLKAKLKELTGLTEIPDFTHYHKKGMLEQEKYLKDIKKEDTFLRLLNIERLETEKNSNILEFGSHLFYPDISPSLEFKNTLNSEELAKFTKWKNLHPKEKNVVNNPTKAIH